MLLWGIYMCVFSRNGKQDRRFFVLVPHGATWVEVLLTAHQYTGSRRFALHLQQLAPHTPFRELSRNDNPVLESEGDWRGGMKVKGGIVMEVCLTQWWSSLGDSTVSTSRCILFPKYSRLNHF